MTNTEKQITSYLADEFGEGWKTKIFDISIERNFITNKYRFKKSPMPMTLYVVFMKKYRLTPKDEQGKEIKPSKVIEWLNDHYTMLNNDEYLHAYQAMNYKLNQILK